MNEDRIESWKQNEINKIKSTVLRVIADSCRCPGQNYKKKIPLSDLISYKYDRQRYKEENRLLELYISAVDIIVLKIKITYPFIDLTGIDMSWTAEDIANVAAAGYIKVNPFTLKELKSFYEGDK